MSQSRTMLIGIPLSVTIFMVAYQLTGSKIVSVIPAGFGMLAALLLVWYSPYPDSTHNFGAGLKRQQWGFTSEQDGDKWIHEPRNGGEQ